MMAGCEETKEATQHLIGTCMGMCPNGEMRLRQREKIVHPLEMAVDSNGQRLSYPQPRAMVKVYSRPAAGQQIKACDVRPLLVLMKTLRYLLAHVCCRKDVPWTLVYQFVCDRLLAIRQDLCVQGARNTVALQIYQAAIRFYVYAHYRTCRHELKDFDPFLNMKQLTETLSLVMTIYEELNLNNCIPSSDRTDLGEYTSFNDQEEEIEEEEEGSVSDSDSDNKGDEGAETKILEDSRASEKKTGETLNTKRDSHNNDSTERESVESSTSERKKDETRNKKSNSDIVPCINLQEEAIALYLLVNLGKEEAIMKVLEHPQNIKYSKLINLTMKINIAWLTNNYYRTLKLSTLLPPICQCAFHLHLSMIQRKSLGVLNKSHSCKGQLYSLKELSQMLLYNSSEELAEACFHYGLEVRDGGVIFAKGKFDWETSLMKPFLTNTIQDHLASVTLDELLLPTLELLT